MGVQAGAFRRDYNPAASSDAADSQAVANPRYIATARSQKVSKTSAKTPAIIPAITPAIIPAIA